MGERLPPAVAGGRHPHQAGVELVLDIAPEHAVLDQHRALCRSALVVDVQRAAPAIERTIVHDRDLIRGDLLTDAVAEGRGAFAVEIALESMADGFVQQDAGPAGPQYHR